MLKRKRIKEGLLYVRAALHKIIDVTRLYIRLTAATFLGQQTFAGPLGQQSIFGWHSGPATDLMRQ